MFDLPYFCILFFFWAVWFLSKIFQCFFTTVSVILIKNILHLLTNDSSPMPLDHYSRKDTTAIKTFALICFVVVTCFSMKGIRVYSGKYIFLQESSNSVVM